LNSLANSDITPPGAGSFAFGDHVSSVNAQEAKIDTFEYFFGLKSFYLHDDFYKYIFYSTQF